MQFLLSRLCSLMKSVMQTKIWKKWHVLSSMSLLSFCREETVKYSGSQQLLRHSSSCLEPCHNSNWLLEPRPETFSSPETNNPQVFIMWKHCEQGGHDSPPAILICKGSGHDCEFGTAIPLAITPLQSSVSTCPLKSVSHPYWPVSLEVRGISLLNCAIKQSEWRQTDTYRVTSWNQEL